jgi:PadR family transcriptional regulator, regulatory protein PadR
MRSLGAAIHRQDYIEFRYYASRASRCGGGILIPVTHPPRELFHGLIRMHVLLHAAEEPIFGLAMMRELARHGYRIGPGTLYPLLHGLERSGLLKSMPERGGARPGGRRRRLYRITARGRKALEAARIKVDELHRELHQSHPRRIADSI